MWLVCDCAGPGESLDGLGERDFEIWLLMVSAALNVSLPIKKKRFILYTYI